MLHVTADSLRLHYDSTVDHLATIRNINSYDFTCQEILLTYRIIGYTITQSTCLLLLQITLIIQSLHRPQHIKPSNSTYIYEIT